MVAWLKDVYDFEFFFLYSSDFLDSLGSTPWILLVSLLIFIYILDAVEFSSCYDNK